MKWESASRLRGDPKAVGKQSSALANFFPAFGSVLKPLPLVDPLTLNDPKVAEFYPPLRTATAAMLE